MGVASHPITPTDDFDMGKVLAELVTFDIRSPSNLLL